MIHYPEQPCGGCRTIRTAHYLFVCGCINGHLYDSRYCDKCLLTAIYNIKHTLDFCYCGQPLLDYEVKEV